MVLDGVNLDCPCSKITTIVGPSGCGKTVLLKPTFASRRPEMWFYQSMLRHFSRFPAIVVTEIRCAPHLISPLGAGNMEVSAARCGIRLTTVAVGPPSAFSLIDLR